MKKCLMSAVMAVVLSLVLQTAFLAAEVLYVQDDGTRGYAEKDTDSPVLARFSAGDSILVEERNGNGHWVATLVASPDGDGQTYAWIRADHLGENIPQSRCSHNWGAWTVEREATCTEPGYQYRNCTICGLRDESEIPASGHRFGDFRVTEQPTCTSEGMEVRECEICGAAEGKDIPRTDHTFGSWTVRKAATCTAEGEEVSTCTQCGTEQTRTIPKTPHQFGDYQVTRKATCTAEGEQVRTCKVCQETEKQVIAKLPHTFDEWKVIKEATCTEKGERTHQCKVCKEIEKEEIEMLPHDFEEKIIKAATDHSSGTRSKVCKKCGLKTDEEEFDPEGTLRRGDSGEEVQKMQQLLIDQGFLGEGGADGKFGGGTENALMEFQLSQKLTPDGIGWPQTLKRLNHEFGPWKVTGMMTRTQAGGRVRVCKDCGYEQVEVLLPEPSFEKGSRGEDVKTVQQMLGAVGCDAGTADGIYGQKLDDAFTKFSEEHDETFETGKVTAHNIDALLNAWVSSVSTENWKGEGGTKDPVVLALMIKPSASEDEVYEEGSDEILAYDWTLKNLGSASCRMTALLLNNDKEAGFRENNIVLALDGQQLEANGGNTLSGTFRIPSLEEAEEEALPEETEEEALPEETEEAAETLLEGEEQTETYSAAEEETEESLTAEEETEEAPLLVADEETPMYFCAIVTDEEGAVWCSNVCEF